MAHKLRALGSKPRLHCPDAPGLARVDGAEFARCIIELSLIGRCNPALGGYSLGRKGIDFGQGTSEGIAR